MKIFRNNIEILDPVISDRATEKNELMSEHSVSIDFELDSFVKLQKEDYIVFDNQNFYLNRDYIPEINKSTGGYKYNLTFYSIEERFKDFKLKYSLQGIDELDFKLTTSGDKFLDIVIYSLQKHGLGTFVKGQFPAAVKEIQFQNVDIFTGLNLIAETYELEWWLDNLTLNIGKHEYGNETVLEYDKELDELTFNSSSEKLITRLYPFGSTRNIPFTYRTGQGAVDNIAERRLRLPAGTDYVDLFPNLPANQIIEDVKIFEEIYPRQKNKIVELSTVVYPKSKDTQQDTTAFIIKGDNAFTITENELMPGQPLKIAFDTGNLAGREFELIIKGNNTFEIKYEQQGNVYTPNPTLCPKVGDEFFFFNIKADVVLPTIIPTAEQELLVKSKEFMSKLGSDVVFNAKTRSIHCENNNVNLQIGQKVLLKSPTVGDVHSRVRGYEKSLYNKFECTYTVGGSPQYSRLGTIEKKTEDNKKEIVKRADEIEKYSERQWRDAKETMELLSKSLLNFSNGINPITINTMSLLVGDESLQFRFVNSKTNPARVSHLVQYNKNSKKLTAQAGILQHLTLGINIISSAHKPSEYKYWDVSALESQILNAAEKPYYLYAKCSKSGTGGIFITSEIPIGINSDTDNFHFLIGILNSENAGDRSFTPLYGFSEILPGRITTDKIVSADGNTYFDLLNGIIGGKINFKSGSSGLENISAFVDVKNEAGKAVGVCNLLLKSGIKASGNGYPFHVLNLSKPLIIGNKYTIVVCGGNSGGGSLLVNIGGYQTIDDVFFKDKTDVVKAFSFIPTSDYFDKKTSITFYHYPYGSQGSSTVSWACLYEGDVKPPLTWIEAPEDVQANIADAKQAGVDAQNAVNTTNQNVNSLNAYVDGAFKDGLIDSSEAKAIEKYINIINSEKAGLEATYNKLYSNEYLSGSAEKTALEASYNTYINAGVSGLLSAINTAISDGKTTIAEKQAVDVRFSEYKGHLANLQIAIENANKAIQTKLDALSKGYVDNLQIGAKNLLIDSSFERGILKVENLYGISYSIQKADTDGNSYPRNIIRLDNFNFLNEIDHYCYLNNNNKVIKGKQYILFFKYKCAGGVIGSSSYVKINNEHIYINIDFHTDKIERNGKFVFTPSEDGFINIRWGFVSLINQAGWINIYDVVLAEGNRDFSYTKATEDIEAEISDAKQAGINAQTAADALKNFTDTSFLNGMIDRAEKTAIEKYINTVNESKLSVQSSYSTLYNNTYLEGTAKTNLESAKTAFETAVTNLINSINTAIEDNVSTPAEKADVDAKFNLYNTALATYNARVGEAEKAINDKIKSYADAAQTTANEAKAKAVAAEYLKDALKQDTTVQGGLVLASVIGAKDGTGKVRSYQNGNPGLNKTAFAAGVENFGTLAETKNVDIQHSGAAKIGVFVIGEDGKVRVMDVSTPDLVRLLISQENLPTLSSLIDNATDTSNVTITSYTASDAGVNNHLFDEVLNVPKSDSKITLSGKMNLMCVSDPPPVPGGGSTTIPGTSCSVEIYKKTASNSYEIYTSGSYAYTENYKEENFNVVIQNVPAGDYKVGINYSIYPSGSVQITNTSMTYTHDNQVRRVEFGKDGLMAFFNYNAQKSFLHLSEIDGIKAGGKVDFPGVLATGSVDSSGNIANIWGAKAGNTASYQGNGVFRINHNIGHSNYTLTVNCSVENCIVAVSTKTATYADIVITRNGSRYGSTGFDFAIYGKNYV